MFSQKQWEEQQVKAAPHPPFLPEDEEMELKAEVSRSEGLLLMYTYLV